MIWRFDRDGTWVLLCLVGGGLVGVATHSYPMWGTIVACVVWVILVSAFVYGCFVDRSECDDLPPIPMLHPTPGGPSRLDDAYHHAMVRWVRYVTRR